MIDKSDLIGDIAERIGNRLVKDAPSPISRHVLLIRLKDSDGFLVGNAQWATLESAREAMRHCTNDSGDSMSSALTDTLPNSFWVVVYSEDTQVSEIVLLSRLTAKGGST